MGIKRSLPIVIDCNQLNCQQGQLCHQPEYSYHALVIVWIQAHFKDHASSVARVNIRYCSKTMLQTHTTFLRFTSAYPI